MDKSASPKADKTQQTSPGAPFTTFIQLDGRSPVPSQFRTPGTFTITRLQSPAGLPDRITKLFARPRSKAAKPIQLARGTLNRYLLILKRLIFESSVRAGSPSFVAAPDRPEIRP
jgi:hypothetical protein